MTVDMTKKMPADELVTKFLDRQFYLSLSNQGEMEGRMEIRWDKADKQVRATNEGILAGVTWQNPMARKGYY